MAGSNHDAPLIGYHLTLWMTIEGASTRVHRWCQHVAFQTEDEFTNLVVGLGTNICKFLLKGLRRPRLQSPVLVIDKNATILDTGRGADVVLLVTINAPVALIHRNIGPPVPRTDTYRLADMKHTIGQTSCVRASNI